MSFAAVFEARAKDGQALHRFIADTDLLLDLAEEIARHPGRPRGVSFTWCRGDTLRSPGSLLKALRWMEQFLGGSASMASRAMPPRSAPPLHHAAASGDMDKLRAAMERARKIDRFYGDKTALMWAVLNDQAEVAAVLLEAGARVDARVEVSELEEVTPELPRPIDLSRYGYAEGDLAGAIDLCEKAQAKKARVWVSGV